MPTEPVGPKTRREIDGWIEFEAALRSAFATLARAGAREVWLSDETFAGWPLGERAVVEQLDAWAASSRRMVLLARRFDAVARRHPRWVDWRTRWSHVVSCRTDPEPTVDPWPTLLVAPGAIALRLVDAERHRGWLSSEPRDIVDGREPIDALLQRSIETFPATTLGL